MICHAIIWQNDMSNLKVRFKINLQPLHYVPDTLSPLLNYTISLHKRTLYIFLIHVVLAIYLKAKTSSYRKPLYLFHLPFCSLPWYHITAIMYNMSFSSSKKPHAFGTRKPRLAMQGCLCKRPVLLILTCEVNLAAFKMGHSSFVTKANTHNLPCWHK